MSEEKVPIVTTGAKARKIYEKVQRAGVKVIPVVPSVAMAKMMVKDGVDALIAEGTRSGGHVGKTTTMALGASGC